MQAAGDFIAIAAEFTAGMQDSQNDFQCGNAHLGMDSHRNTTSVVLYRDNTVRFQSHFDMGTIACQCLVNGVIHDFIHQMMQATCRCRANVHARTFADCFQSFQYLNLAFIIGFPDSQIQDLLAHAHNISSISPVNTGNKAHRQPATGFMLSG